MQACGDGGGQAVYNGALNPNPELSMFWTNIVLALAFIGMIALFVWLFRDGEGPMTRPGVIRKSGDEPPEESGGERRDEPPR